MDNLKNDRPCLICGEAPCSPDRRPGEDGRRIRKDGPCDTYRYYCPAPGYCWCGHWCERHAGWRMTPDGDVVRID